MAITVSSAASAISIETITRAAWSRSIDSVSVRPRLSQAARQLEACDALLTSGQCEQWETLIRKYIASLNQQGDGTLARLGEAAVESQVTKTLLSLIAGGGAGRTALNYLRQSLRGIAPLVRPGYLAREALKVGTSAPAQSGIAGGSSWGLEDQVLGIVLDSINAHGKRTTLSGTYYVFEEEEAERATDEALRILRLTCRYLSQMGGGAFDEEQDGTGGMESHPAEAYLGRLLKLSPWKKMTVKVISGFITGGERDGIVDERRAIVRETLEAVQRVLHSQDGHEGGDVDMQDGTGKGKGNELEAPSRARLSAAWLRLLRPYLVILNPYPTDGGGMLEFDYAFLGNDEELLRRPRAEPDVAFLVADLIHRSYSPIGLSNTANTIFRISALIQRRLRSSHFPRKSEPGRDKVILTGTVLEILLASTEEVRKVGVERASKRARSWTFSRFPEIFRDLIASGRFSQEAENEGMQGILANALRSFRDVLVELDTSARVDSSSMIEEMEVDSPTTTTSEVLEALLLALFRHDLVLADVAASLSEGIHDSLTIPWSPEDLTSRFMTDQNDLQDSLGRMSDDCSSQRAVISAVQICIQTWSTNNDLSPLAFVCSQFSSSLDILEVFFLHVQPKELLHPILTFLESFENTAENFDNGHPIERYGTVVLFLETVVARFHLYRDLTNHLNTNTGFFLRWLPSVSAVHTLPSLDEESRYAIAGWISALFGDGISDDLIHSTDPRVLLRIAPTICKQSFAACQAGVIDLDTLREGLSYFLQDLLSFTLPGVLRWLIAEIMRIGPSPPHIDILLVFIYSEALPSPVLELISADLDALLLQLSMTPEPLLDVTRLSTLVSPLRTSAPESISPPSWIEQFKADLAACVDLPHIIRPNLSVSLHSTLISTSSTSFVLSTLFSKLLSLVRFSDLGTINEEDVKRELRIEAVGASILSFIDQKGGHKTSWPLIETLLRTQILPSMLASFAAISPVDEELEGEENSSEEPERELGRNKAQRKMVARIIGMAFARCRSYAALRRSELGMHGVAEADPSEDSYADCLWKSFGVLVRKARKTTRGETELETFVRYVQVAGSFTEEEMSCLRN